MAWILFALVAIAGVLNIYDRQIISVLKPVIAADLGWSDDDYGTLAAAFQGAAAIAFLFTGWIVDRLGARWGNALGVGLWSLAAISHSFVQGFWQFFLCRIALGATEAMGTPGFTRALTEILPPSRRTLGFGLLNAIGSAGAIVSPLLIPLIALTWSWRAAFLIGGMMGLAWLVLWIALSRGQLAGAPAAGPVPAQTAVAAAAEPSGYLTVLRNRSTWSIGAAKLLSDGPWWLISYWVPDLLHRNFALGQAELGVPLAMIFGAGVIGSLCAGYGVTNFIARGTKTNVARLVCFAATCTLIMPLPLVMVANLPVAIMLLCLMVAGHQAFSTNLFALIADAVPIRDVGKVVGFGAFCGNAGGMIVLKVTGLVLTSGQGYTWLLVYCPLSYLLALFVLLPLLRKKATPLHNV